MAEYISPVSGVVKLVAPTIWNYIKFQITPNSYMTECESEKEKLQRRLNDIEIKLQSQLMGIGKIPKQEVEDWLKRARDAITETDEDHFSKGGCFCNICRAKRFYKLTQEMKVIHVAGETYIHADVILVQDDHAVIKDHLMRGFQNTYGSVQLRRKDIESTLWDQIHFGKIVKEEVNGWLENTEKKLETAQDEVSRGESLSPPLLAELLDRKIRELNDLLEKGEKYIRAGVILVKDDPSTTRGVPLYAEKCYGRDTALAEIPKLLKGDQVTRIAVWGMGGIGKTTLMKQIYNQFLKEAEFDKVMWVTVSSKLDICRIQNEIAQLADGEPLEEKDANRRAGNVSARLRRGNFLLILDDVWEAFSDEDVGFPKESGGLKLVVTTRAADVARQIGCDEIIKLQPLTFEESLQLFLDKVGKIVLSDDGNIKLGLKAALMKIVKECDGLPLAIVTVASTMKRCLDHQHSWLKALKQLRKGKSVVSGEKDPIRIFQFSYDRLEDERVRHCFLYCALFPEDFENPKEQLIEYWIEERLIDQMDTRHEMICEGHEILRKLQDNCLLECIVKDADKIGQEDLQMLGLNEDIEMVQMHDLLRDMALGIMSKSPRFFVKARGSKDELQKEEAWPADVERVSLMMNYNSMKEIPVATTHLKYNMLTTLLMPNNMIFTIPESFFIHTPSLRILDVSWNTELRSLPNSISALVNLTTLLLEGCDKLKKVPSLSKCWALTKLDLGSSGIEEVPDGMEMLVNLNYLSVYDTMIKLPRGLLPKLSNLQHLLVDDREIRVEEVIKLRKMEYLDADLGERLEEMSILLVFMQKQVERLTSYTLQVATPLLALKLNRDLKRITALLFNDGKWICHLNSYDRQDEDRDIECVNRIFINQALRLQFLIIKYSKNIECAFVRGFNPLQTLEGLKSCSLAKPEICV